MRQKWGQNFLVDRAVASRIVEAIQPAAEDRVLEIGPGEGILTEFLVGRVAELTVVELDRELAEYLGVRWGGRPGYRAVHADFLDWPLPAPGNGVMKIIGNLPYSAAAAILRKFLDWSGWRTAVVMVQKEVGDRIVAGAGTPDYGILSLAVQAKAEAERLFDVGPRSFRPAPKVTSTVLRLARRPASRLAREERFFEVVHAAFGQRRKMILNGLSHGLGLEKEAVRSKLTEAGVDPARRPETLTLEEYNRLAEVF